MKRLRDMEPGSELQRKARQMIEAVDPVPASPERMARIRRKLDAPHRGGVLVALQRLPAIAVAALIALFGASAFAAVRVFVEAREADAAQAAQEVERARKHAQVPQAPKVLEAVAAPAEPPRVIEPAPAQLALEADEVEAAAEPQGASPRATPRPRSKAAPVRTPDEEQAEIVHDSELVHRAVKALRRDGNPALAARLLEEDRVRNPSGPLAEEALSLRIEAALALHDARAVALAQQYVARYPSGRYLAIARRALSEGAPK
jgi:hypothetical protein